MAWRQLKLMSAKYLSGHQRLKCCGSFGSDNASRGVATCFCESPTHSHFIPLTSYTRQMLMFG